MEDFDFVDISRWGERNPVRREPTTSAYWYAIGVIRERRGLAGNEPLPPGVYLVDDGDGALIIEIDETGGLAKFAFDAACPPTAEWAGTPAGSQEPSSGG